MRILLNVQAEYDTETGETRIIASKHQDHETTSKKPTRGITYAKQHRKWRVRVKKIDKWCHVGYYITEEEATTAYNVACINAHYEQLKLQDVADV